MSRRPLRVAHLMQYFAIGGLERMVQRLSIGSKSRGIEPMVVAYSGDGPIREALEEQGVETRLLLTGPGLHPELTLKLRQLLRQEQIDVLHTHHVGPFLYGAPAALVAGCRHVHTEHSHELYDTARRQLVGALMSPMAEVVAVTPEISRYRRRFPGRCSVIPNGVPIPTFDPSMRARGRDRLQVDQGSFVIGCAARLAAEKNHAGLLEAFAGVLEREPRAVLACAGDGPLGAALREQAEKDGVSPHVRWLGAVQDMDSFYSALDVCVLNSDREGLPLCLLEAMSHGIPVVATNVGGVEELLCGDSGLLVPARAPKRLADALVSVREDPELAQTLRRKGIARIREEYSIDAMVDRYVELYRGAKKSRFLRSGIESAKCG